MNRSTNERKIRTDMATEDEFEEYNVQLGRAWDGILNIGHDPNAETPTVVAHMPGLGAMLCSPAAARLIAERYLLAADQAEGKS